jgi:hypothetical protein
MGAINVNVSIGENYISYSKINGSRNDFMDNIYNVQIQCLVINYLLDNLFK